MPEVYVGKYVGGKTLELKDKVTTMTKQVTCDMNL